MARPTVLSTDDVLLKVRVPRTEAAALKSLVAHTGEARASHLRRAISRYLAEFDLASSVVVTPVTPTTAQRGSTR